MALLRRQSDGTFEGSFDLLRRNKCTLPSAVEDTTAAHVDARNNRPELLVYQQGKPTVAAVAQQFNDVVDRSPDSALTVARRATELHPDDPDAWSGR